MNSIYIGEWENNIATKLYNMNGILLIEEWRNICEQFIQQHQSKHKWGEDECFDTIWSSIKHLNSN